MIKLIWLSAALILAHDWYPKICCDESHCRPVDCEEISYDSDWQRYMWHGIKFFRDRAGISPDGKCHVCTVGGNKTGLCIFLGGTS
jgi:hypothetical protein